MPDQTIHHKADCPGADVEPFTGARGVALYICRGCRRFGLTPARHRPATLRTAPTTPPAQVDSDPAAAAIDHAPECPQPRRVDTLLGHQGNVLARCPACRRTAPTTPLETPRAPSPTQSTPATPPPLVTRYVCPEHLQPVTWRGRGCPDCAAERRPATRRGADNAGLQAAR